MLHIKKNPIQDDYDLSSEIIGAGALGKVYKCSNRSTEKNFAVKVIADEAKARREIELHFRACQDCSYIVQIIDIYENHYEGKASLLIVMELMEGGELFWKISDRENPFTEREIAKIMFQICSAVKHLHEMGIAHRDLKPENLLLSTDDENAVVKLGDFGFAKEVKEGLTTACYTPIYVAPERIRAPGIALFDVSCDIWSLGVIMYILCCGSPPFHSRFGGAFSPGLKEKITRGEYKFERTKWDASKLSKDAKELIEGMLITEPRDRLNIVQIMASKWISDHLSVPTTPLLTAGVLRDFMIDWNRNNRGKEEAQENKRKINQVLLRVPSTANNQILRHRQQKKLKSNPNAEDALSTSSRNLESENAENQPQITTPEPSKQEIQETNSTRHEESVIVVEPFSRQNSTVVPKLSPEPKKQEEQKVAESRSIQREESVMIIEPFARQNSTVTPK